MEGVPKDDVCGHGKRGLYDGVYNLQSGGSINGKDWWLARKLRRVDVPLHRRGSQPPVRPAAQPQRGDGVPLIAVEDRGYASRLVFLLV